jgi:formylmethanofuran dehydrogenase subunit C
VSNAVTLRLRTSLERRIEADCITPDRFATASAAEIAHLAMWDGRRQVMLGDVFDVDGERSTSVRMTGDLAHVDAIGAGMTAGELVIDGPVGRYVGTRMAGGVLRVLGNAAYGAGLEMANGLLDITGDAGDRLGAARLGASKGMTGGEIIVRGNAGAESGTGMRRGTIVITGTAGPRAGTSMIAGNVIVFGDADDAPGQFNKRGSIVVFGHVTVPPNYRYVCTYRPPHLAVTLVYLRARRDVAVNAAWNAGLFRRHSGDMAEVGRGEILEWRSEA